MQAITNFEFLTDDVHEVAQLELNGEESPILAEKWRRMGTLLESHNFPKEKISRKVRELIESERLKILLKQGINKDEAKKEAKFKTRHYFKVMSKEGWTDPSKNKTKSGELVHQESSSDKVLEKSSYATERRIYIQFMKDIKNESEKIITELQRNDVDWQPLFESPEIADSFFKLIRDMFYNEQDEWNRIHDNRQSILPKMLIPMTAFKALTLDKYFCSKYFAEIKKGVTISPKKYSYFLKDVSGLSDLLHYVKEDAWLWNFIDINCPLCKEKSLKVRMESDGTWKFVCKNWKIHNTDKIFPSTLLGKKFESLKNKMSADRFLKNKSIITPLN